MHTLYTACTYSITHRTKAKTQSTRTGCYLGTAQQCTEASTLLWVQGLAKGRKIVRMYATKLLYK